MSPEAKRRVIHRVTQSGALPVSRDAPGYTAVLDVLGIINSSEEEGGTGARLDRNNGDAWAGAATDTIVGSFSFAGVDTLGFIHLPPSGVCVLLGSCSHGGSCDPGGCLSFWGRTGWGGSRT